MSTGRVFRAALFAGCACLALDAALASAQEASPPTLAGIAAPASPDEGTFSISVSEGDRVAFTTPGDDFAPPRMELEIAADSGPVDVSFSRSAIIGDGDPSWRGGGAQLRIGRGLVERRGQSAPDSAYVYVASDNEALTWRPGARNQGGALALQEQVEVGDVSAGIAVERGGVQAALSYVERDASTRVGGQNYSQEESFTGITVTMRR